MSIGLFSIFFRLTGSHMESMQCPSLRGSDSEVTRKNKQKSRGEHVAQCWRRQYALCERREIVYCQYVYKELNSSRWKLNVLYPLSSVFALSYLHSGRMEIKARCNEGQNPLHQFPASKSIT